MKHRRLSRKKIYLSALLVALNYGILGIPSYAFAASKVDPALNCSSNNCDLIGKYVNPAIMVLGISFGLIATISLIIGAIQYSASEGDPQKSAAAKNRITNTIIAIVAFLFLFAFLEFLIPGGVFNRQLTG